MPEVGEEQEKRALRELEGKNIAHYSVLLTAWIETKMERDKTLVTLSAGGIALLVTILTTVGVKSNLELALFVLALVGFLISIWSYLQIYERNSRHIEQEMRGTEKKDLRLEKFDRLSLGAFLIAALCAILIGIVSAITQINNPP